MSIIKINDKHYQEVDVVMMDSNKESQIYLADKRTLYKTGIATTKNPRHIYFFNDEKIKIGDWVNHIILDDYVYQVNYDNYEASIRNNVKKIIASTDTSLRYTDLNVSPVPNFCDLPVIPQSFIKQYIDAFNKGNTIYKALVEVELRLTDFIIGKTIQILKINEKNEVNTLIEEQKKSIKDFIQKHGITENELIDGYTIGLGLMFQNAENIGKESWSKEEIMSALHKVELKHNKDYSKLWNEIEKNLK